MSYGALCGRPLTSAEIFSKWACGEAVLDALLQNVLNNWNLPQQFLCDTFKGVVKAGNQDLHYRGGEHADTSMDTVRQLATDMGLGNVELLEGIFPDATGDRIKDRQFSLCHIDVDVYESA
jgi:hypothetical protein